MKKNHTDTYIMYLLFLQYGCKMFESCFTTCLKHGCHRFALRLLYVCNIAATRFAIFDNLVATFGQYVCN